MSGAVGGVVVTLEADGDALCRRFLHDADGAVYVADEQVFCKSNEGAVATFTDVGEQAFCNLDVGGDEPDGIPSSHGLGYQL